MAKRMIIMLALVVALVSGLGFIKYKQVETAIHAAAGFQPPPQAVTTVVAKREQWPSAMNFIGSVEAVQGVMVAADLPGTVAKINFDSGKAVHAGDVLVELDTRQERAQLHALEAQRDLAKLNYDRSQQLAKQGVISRMDYDKASADQRQTDANVAEIKATIERKTIRAPFSGILGIRKINLGEYLAAGAPIVSLQSLNPIYVNFDVPQQNAGQVQVGRTINVTREALAGKVFTGRVTALDSVINETTRNIQVQATLPNPSAKLRPGMFVQVDLSLGASQPAITLPASAISYAPYGDSVFVVADLKDPKGNSYKGVRQQFVKIGPSRGDQVAIFSGLNSGDEVVSSGVFKLRNGAAVTINNKIQPSNNPA
ncbi:MAG: efflux RND transporter periplasmic adaptor subunit, partial [Terriglobales bacterium]